MISAILQPLTRSYSRLVAMGNPGEMVATRLPGERVATLTPAYHNGYQVGGYVTHRGDNVYPVDLAAKFEAWASEHEAYCGECNENNPYFKDPSSALGAERAWREMQAIASALLPDETLESMPLWPGNPHGVDPAMVRAALEGDATVRFELYQQTRQENA